MRASTQQFYFDTPTKHFVTEASELSQGGRIDMFHRIYDDAMDVGLVLVSHRTGREATYYLHEEKRNSDRDLMVWILLPTPQTLRKMPEVAGTEIHILND